MTATARRRPILVREATAADVPAVRAVALAAWRATYRGLIPRRAIERFVARAYSTERVELRLARHDVLVAARAPRGGGGAVAANTEDARQTVEAFAECAPEGGHLTLVALYANPRARGRGLGTALLDAVLARYPGLDIAADVLLGNVRGEPFYAARGFEPGETLEEELGGVLVVERRWWRRAGGAIRPRPMPALDDLWDYDDPAASETRFRTAVDAADALGDARTTDEARTQLARSLGLQRRFEEAHAELDRVDADHPAEDRVRVRSRLERGRAFRSAGEPAASIAPFVGAWELARSLGEDGLAVDAAHMLALVNAPPGEPAWHSRALELADSSGQPAARKWRGSLWNNIGWARFEAGDLDGAMTAFETALGARREQGQPKETRVAEWCVGRCLRALGRTEEALAIQQRLLAETAAAGASEDGYMSEEIGECLLALGRGGEARPFFARASELLAADAWLAEQEPARIERLRQLGAAFS